MTATYAFSKTKDIHKSLYPLYFVAGYLETVWLGTFPSNHEP